MEHELGKTLKRIRKECGLTQAELASGAGVTTSAIGNIEAGTRGYGGATIVSIARVLGVTPEELLNQDMPTSNVRSKAAVPGLIPLISWVRAGDFCESPDNFAPGDAEEFLPRPVSNMGANTFALTVRGDSMDAKDGYQDGDIVYVDPDVMPTPGSDVVARTDAGVTLKRYRVDELGPYLLGLNGSVIIRPREPWHVCGVVVFSGRRRSR